MTVDTIAIVRSNLTDAHWLIERVVDGINDDQLHWPPPGTANTIAATYAHVIASEDMFVQETLQKQKPLCDGDWSGRTGISLPAPRRGSEWFAWSRRVRVDLASARSYAAAVYAATEDYVSHLDPEQLARLPDVPLPGQQTLNWLINNFVVQHAALHSGEIAVLRGLQGMQGLP